MSMSLLAVAPYLAVLASQQPAAAPATESMEADVQRLVRAAEKRTDVWPAQAPPPIPEVAPVARHGKGVTPLLLALLSDDPDAERDPKRWKVQQQAALALCRIYSESEHCGRTYCDGDPPERIRGVKGGWLAKIASDAQMQALSARELLDRIKREQVFWRQLELGKALAATGDGHAVGELDEWLTHEDRHVRGNAAYVLARLGDRRGFDTIAGIIADRRSDRPRGQGIPGGNWTPRAQVRADRFYAVKLLGELKDSRGVELLVPLMSDPDVHWAVPPSLAEIGEPRAVKPLLRPLDQDDPSMRVLAISALGTLKARAALTRLRELLHDDRRSNFGTQTTVADAARRAIAVIDQLQ